MRSTLSFGFCLLALLLGSAALAQEDRSSTVAAGAISNPADTLAVGEPGLREPAAPGPKRQLQSRSGITTQPLSPVQIENLLLLGKVWGFVKYHHPRITGGEVDWDAELFRVLPAVLRARDHITVTGYLTAWLRELGELEPCNPCAESPSGVYLAPDLDWIHHTAALGPELMAQLRTIYRNRRAGGPQRYVSHVAGIGNPNFSGEVSYVHEIDLDAGYRLLALFRFWNVIEHWFPYRDIIGGDWDEVLREFIPRTMAAESQREYQLEMTQLTARINDSHGGLWSLLELRPPYGTAQLPLLLRFVEGKAAVTGYSHPALGPATGLRVGDVIERIDGMPIDSLVEAWKPSTLPRTTQPCCGI